MCRSAEAPDAPRADLPAAAGRIVLICGCMFSGKSERLITRLQRARADGLPVRAFKHTSDDRYADRAIVTHTGQRIEALPVPRAAEIPPLAGEARLVAIDEAQFFGEELIEVCRRLAERGVTIVVAGLDLDSWGQPFGPMPGLARIAHEVLRTHARCARCGQQADHTQRLTPVANQTMIGGPESYEPRCAACFESPPLELRR